MLRAMPSSSSTACTRPKSAALLARLGNGKVSTTWPLTRVDSNNTGNTTLLALSMASDKALSAPLSKLSASEKIISSPITEAPSAFRRLTKSA